MGWKRSGGWLFTMGSIAGAVAAAACGSFGSNEDAQPGANEGGPGADGAPDAANPDGSATADAPPPVAKCNALKPFATPPFLFPVTEQLDSARLGSDGALYVQRTISGKKQLGRTTFSDGGIASDITPILPQSLADDEQGMLYTDGLGLVFHSDRTTPGGPSRLHVSVRPNTVSEFTTELEIPIVGAPAEDATTDLQDPWVTKDRIYFVATPATGPGSGSKRLMVADIDATGRKLANPRDVFAAPNAGANVDHPLLSHDELELFYVGPDGRVGRTTRTSVTDPFAYGTPLLEIAGSAKATWISPDDCDLYYFTNDAVGSGLHRISRR